MAFPTTSPARPPLRRRVDNPVRDIEVNAMNQGHCLCGSVAWEIVGEPFQAFNCHCKLCRKAHGTAFGTYWFMRQDQLRLTSGMDTMVHYRSSHLLNRRFCGVCGSVVPYPGDNGDFVIAPGGCHDWGRKSDCNIFVPHGAPWHEVTGDLPRHRDYPPETGYPRVEEEPLPESPEGVVRGYCMCGAIEFHTTVPYTRAHYCHCGRCRRGRAAPFASNGIVSIDGVHHVRGEDRLKSYKVPGARRFTQVFCETCGSKMPHIDKDRGVAVVPLGILEDDPGIRPSVHIYGAYKAKWHDITDDLPVLPEHYQ